MLRGADDLQLEGFVLDAVRLSYEVEADLLCFGSSWERAEEAPSEMRPLRESAKR
ncbi:MAG: hypothetical protein ACYC8T_20410 [Myxococcaceae bacterium]